MNPGRELDFLIATKVMGWKVLSHWDADGTIKHLVDENQCEVTPPEFKPYSTDIAAAWTVVERVKDLGFESYKIQSLVHPAELGWLGHEVIFKGKSCVDAIGESAPHAICLAALEAVK